MKRKFIIVLIGALWGLSSLASKGCEETEDAEESGTGMLTAELWGEEYIETGIPATEFADGYGITYAKFLICLSAISVAEEGTAPALTASEMKVWNMTVPGPTTIASVEAEAGDYTHTAYRISPAAAGATAGNATAEDVQMMVDNGLSVYVEGVGTDGTTTVSFAWGFNTDKIYDPCHSHGALAADGEAKVQITIHGDHLFYDDAVSETPVLRFNDIALADADTNGEVTLEELAAYNITVLPNYGVGSLDISNLADYIAHMTTTLGHIDGEGHCE